MKSKQQKYSERFAYVFGVIGNFATVPQIIRAWQAEAPGLAVSTWALFTCISIVWLWYAIAHRLKPLIVAQIVGITCNSLVVIGWALHN